MLFREEMIHLNPHPLSLPRGISLDAGQLFTMLGSDRQTNLKFIVRGPCRAPFSDRIVGVAVERTPPKMKPGFFEKFHSTCMAAAPGRMESFGYLGRCNTITRCIIIIILRTSAYTIGNRRSI